MTKSIYTRLTRTKRGFFGYTQLWLAPDHVLLVTNSRFSERYQRFFLADIQAIIVSDWPARGRIPLFALAAVSTGVVTASSSAFGKGFWAVMALLFLVLAGLDVIRGPHCRCLLQTAVSRTVLLPVSRQRQAKTFLSVVAPLIQSAQEIQATQETANNEGLTSQANTVGAVANPETNQAFTFDQTAPPITLFGAIVNRPDQPPALPAERRSYAWILFGFLLLTGPVAWAALSHPREAIGVLWTVYLGEATLTGMVLVQDRSDPWKVPYLLAVVAAILVVIDAGFVSGAAGLSEFFSLLRRGALPAQVDYGWLSASQAIAFSAGWRLLIGAFGMGAWWLESGNRLRKLKST